MPKIMPNDKMNDKTSKYTPQDLQLLKATLWIGKMGCTENIIEEIRRQTKTEEIIKVKWLRNTDIDPKAVAEESGTVLIQARGRTMVLARKKDSASKKAAAAQNTAASKPKTAGPAKSVKNAGSQRPSYARPAPRYSDFDDFDDYDGERRRSPAKPRSFAPHMPQNYSAGASDSRLGYMPKNSINSERRNPYTSHTRSPHRDSGSGAGSTAKPAGQSGRGKAVKGGSRPAGRSSKPYSKSYGGAKRTRPTKSRQKISPDKRRH